VRMFLGDRGQFGGDLTGVAVFNEPLATADGTDSPLQRLCRCARVREIVEPCHQLLGTACQTLDERDKLLLGARLQAGRTAPR